MAKKKSVRKAPASSIAAAKLAPVIEALTTTGPGRWGIICDAFEEGLLKDRRLRPYVIAGLDDRSSDIAKTIADYVIPLYGRSAYPDIKARLNINGNWADAKKLQLLFKIDRVRTRPLIEQIFRSGSTQLRTQVLWSKYYRLPKDLPVLMQFAKARAISLRDAALTAIIDVESDEVLELWKEALAKPKKSVSAAWIRFSTNQRLVEHVTKEIVRELDEMCLLTDRTLVEKKVSRLLDLCSSFWDREHIVPADFGLQLLARHPEVSKITAGGIFCLLRQMSNLIARYAK